MAVGFDAAFESHTGTTGSTSQASFSWNHTPVGTPKGVLVFVITNDNADYVTSITYDGVNVPAVPGAEAADTATEPGRCKAFFLGSGVPTTSPAVVQVNRTNNATEMYAVSITVTAATDTCVHLPGIVLTQENGGLGERAVGDGSPGTDSMRFAGGFFGHSTIPSVGANSTAVHDMDIGTTRAYRVVRETTAGQGFRFVGFSSGVSDDRAVVHLAVKEIFTSSLSGATGTLSGSLSKINNKALSGAAGSLTGNLFRMTSKSLTGVAGALSATLSAAKVAIVSISGTAGALSGTLARQMNKPLSGAISSVTGALVKKTNKSLTGASGAVSGALSTAVGKFVSLVGSVGALSGSLVKRINKPLAGSTGSLSGAITKRTNKALSGTTGSLAGALSTLKFAIVNLTGSVGVISGTVAKRINKSLSGSVDFLAGSITKAITKSFSGVIGALTGNVLTYAPTLYLISIAGVVGNFIGSVTHLSVVRRAKMKAGNIVKTIMRSGSTRRAP